MEIQNIKIPRGARIGPDQEPIYGWHDVVPVAMQGGLAVHKAAPGDKFKWAVTHVTSGLCLGPICARTKARAVQNMRAALALPFDWTMDESDTIQALRDSRGIYDAIVDIGRD